jgi:hypothetical protein
MLTVKAKGKSKTVGFLRDRDRLVHRWVSERMLNVQSDLSEMSRQYMEGKS